MLTDGKETKNGVKRTAWHYFKRFWMDYAHVHLLVFYTLVRKPRVHYMGSKDIFKGGAMICPNHTSFDDPLVLHAAIPHRRLYYMASELALATRWKMILLGGAGCIKVDRNISDINSLRRVTQHLKWGYIVGVFPQGTVVRDQSMDKDSLKSGAILIAMQAKTPIVPVYLAPYPGDFKHRDIVFGEPIYLEQYCTKKFPSMKDIDVMTNVLYDGMMSCRTYYEEQILPNKK